MSSETSLALKWRVFSISTLLVFFSLFVLGSGCGGGSSGGDSGEEPTCSVSQIESDMDTVLAQVSTDVNFSFSVQREDGRRYTYNRGASTLATSYKSASTSKMVTAVIILRLVDQGYLKLTDHPQDWISDWPITSDNALYDITLAQLLSFTSGLSDEPLCLNLPNADFETCVRTIASNNAQSDYAPGEAFYYAGTHLQVAGLMAVKASGLATWQEVFTAFTAQTGLFPTGAYDLPSASNPRLAGGMHWTGEEYLAFLKALNDGALLDPQTLEDQLSDHTASAVMANSPAYNALAEEWHYGFGLWQECRSSTYDCTPGSRVSSPGAYGAYPFWDRSNGYFGILARQGKLGTFRDGIAIERAVQNDVDAWAQCQ